MADQGISSRRSRGFTPEAGGAVSGGSKRVSTAMRGNAAWCSLNARYEAEEYALAYPERAVGGTTVARRASRSSLAMRSEPIACW